METLKPQRSDVGSKLFVGLTLALIMAVASLVLTPGRTALAQTAPAASGAVVTGVSAGVSDSISRLYIAVFSRQPEAEGHQYWVNQYLGGTGLPTIAESFMSSSEWQRRMGELSDGEFVDLLYVNVLDRPSDDAGQSYWLGQAASGLSRTDMLLWFSEGTEFIKRTGTANPEPPPFPSIPQDSGTGRRIVYSNTDQRVWIVEASGHIRDSYLVSGREGVPNPGTYSVFSKSSIAYAGHDGITMNHMVRFAWGQRLAIGFHSIPRYSNGGPMQSEAQLGTYQSAGCIRQADHQAEALFHWAEVGDTVVVVP